LDSREAKLETDTILQQLNVEIAEVEELLIGLILEGKVDGRIDQVGMRLELDRAYVFHLVQHYYRHSTSYSQALEKKRYAALHSWTKALEGVHAAVVAKTAGRGGSDTYMSIPPERMGDFRDIGL
jgi:COP9 signalosome complex subunit 2